MYGQKKITRALLKSRNLGTASIPATYKELENMKYLKSFMNSIHNI
jgi:hypothetical protein